MKSLFVKIVKALLFYPNFISGEQSTTRPWSCREKTSPSPREMNGWHMLWKIASSVGMDSTFPRMTRWQTSIDSAKDKLRLGWSSRPGMQFFVFVSHETTYRLSYVERLLSNQSYSHFSCRLSCIFLFKPVKYHNIMQISKTILRPQLGNLNLIKTR